MASALRLLYVAPEQAAAAAAATAVADAADGIEGAGTDPGTLPDRVERDGVDCVVIEDDPEASETLAVLERVRAVDETVPIVVATDGVGEGRARAALDHGATDYVDRAVARESPALVAHRVEAAVERAGAGAGDTERELERYERIIEGVGDTLYATNAEGEFTHVNPAATRLSGYDVDKLMAGGPTLLYDEADIETFEAAIVELLRSPEESVARVEAELRPKEGDAVPIESTLTLRRDADGSFAGTIGVARDMTARKARERELERYARLIEASGDAVYALDAEGRFTFSNESHQEIVDRPESALLGEHASIALPPEAVEDGESLIQELLAGDRRNGTFEMDVLQPDGTRIPTENHVALLTDEDGQFRGTVGVLRDISDRQARERELERQNERLERFAEIASHDLRNPLNVAQGYLDLVRAEADSEHAERVADALDRMERLIDDTLTMARGGETVDEHESVDLEGLVSECWDAVDGESGSLEVIDDVAVQGDEGRLRQVFENLLRNAVEHGREDVTVRVGPIEGGGFFVEDDGPGIPAAERETVFEAGHTTAADGTGFGLAIVAEIVDAHGWDIAVTEGEAGGARYEITGVDVTA